MNKLDVEITNSLLAAERKCSKIHLHCKYDWSPELKNTLRSLGYAKRAVKKIRQRGPVTTDFHRELDQALTDWRRWKKHEEEVTKSSKDLCSYFLLE